MTEAARLLRHARKRAGLTQRALAAKAGVPQPYVARVESSATDPTVSSLSRLLRACGTTLEALPGSGEGNGTAAMQALLRMTPAERLSAAAADARGLAAFDARGPAVVDPAAALRALSAAAVRFVVIGGLAEAVRGSPGVTDDLDICPDAADDNVERLVASLLGMNATERGSQAPPDAATIRGEWASYDTDFGRLDILTTPNGTSGYADLVAGAEPMDFGDLTVHVVALDDLIRMKRAAARPEDRIEVEVLIALRDAVTERS